MPPQVEVDPAFITLGLCKWKLTSYVNDPDNISADQNEYFKKLKDTVSSSRSEPVESNEFINSDKKI